MSTLTIQRGIAANESVCESLGFGKGTEIAYILCLLCEGKHTKKQIQDKFMARYADNDPEEARRKKSTFDVFFSDIKRPFKTYHASRGLELREDTTTGVVYITQASLRRAQRAVEAGILERLKGITPKGSPVEYNKIMNDFGFDIAA